MLDVSRLADQGRRDRALTAEPAPAPVPQGEPLLLCQRVSKWYGPVIGVNHVTLELRSGITGLVGANGAGKSTLIRLVTGHLRPDAGSVSIGGVDAWKSAARLSVGYCPDADQFWEEMSGRQFVRTMADLVGYGAAESRRRTEAALSRVGMAYRADRTLRGYSKGMRQRIKLAQALLHDPPLLVLDEPLSGIDPVGRAELVALFRGLAEQGKCLMVSSHELDELEKLTDHVVIMARGRVAAADTVPRIRERLADHPATIRVDVAADGDRDHRALAAHLVRLPEVAAVEIGEGRLLVRVRSPRGFHEALARLVLEEWFDVTRLEAVDASTQAVLSYLLGGRSQQ
ncbi:MAG: ABC transporter ATP-binding protein [Gemmataceae bacterium]|nr:ABC transporter ATP-binding protein [Gemmataceae bacterium]